MKRLPLHVRLVAGFAAAMAVLLCLAGGFVYERVAYALDRGLATDLHKAVATITPLVGPQGTVSAPARATATGTDWQVIRDGRVVAHGGAASDAPIVAPSRLPQTGSRTLDVGSIFLLDDSRPVRVRAVRLSADGPWLLVAVRRQHRDEALRELFGQLLLAGVVSLALATAVGSMLARSALRPVERYRHQAAEIARGRQGLRLDVPADRHDEVTRLGHTLNAMLGAQEQALERERRFVQDASHELRTPLTLLKARIQLARSRPRDAAAYERTLDELGADVDRLVQLGADLLEQAEPSGSAEPVDVAALAREAAADHGIADVRVAEPALATGLADHEVRRVLTNLLDNALLHGSAPVSLSARTTGPWVVLEVEDAGEGLAPDLLRSVTGRFTRAPEARSRRGSGLGLSLVEQLVTSAGGELRLCCGGDHAAYGVAAGVPCAHDQRMRVTVLLPRAIVVP
ncbi:two-component sensor histidine kinase [Nocardioides phosphati]|uniref:histidine kinase n=1 Tax=Nocardioides phosphati TaxID=1867775 RepID=A0ABQ2N7N5_9ACTN|nr:HAMP domain-containing sensor histidine kinase [Nocardioides phosphati]GGO86281.1 two-component sensor histidine kinase [Nocardioides phosphati]